MSKLLTIIAIGTSLYVLKKRGAEFGIELPDAGWYKAGSENWNELFDNVNTESIADYFVGATQAVTSGLQLPKSSPVISTLKSTLVGLGEDVINVVPETFNSVVATVYQDSKAALLEQIAAGEGTSDDAAQLKGYASGFDVTLGYGAYADDKHKPITSMTFRELKAFQTSMLSNGRNSLNSSAAGKYQNTRTNLFGNGNNGWYGMMQEAGFKLSDKYSKSAQTKIAELLLEKRGYSDYKAGRITAKEFQRNLSKEWASIADPFTNKSTYGQHVGTTTAQIMPLIENIA